MAKRHYIPITADVPGVNEGQRAFIRKVIRTALAAEGVDFPCEVDVLLTNDEAIHQINLDMREVDRATDVLSFPEFDLQPGELPGAGDIGGRDQKGVQHPDALRGGQRSEAEAHGKVAHPYRHPPADTQGIFVPIHGTFLFSARIVLLF